MDKLVNIVAFLLPVGLFVYFGILGTAVLSVLRTQRNLLQNLLLSPAVGIAFTLLLVFLLNRAGFPVKYFAIPLTVFSFFLSITIILYRKSIIPFSRYIGFALIFFLALCLTGRPLFHFGFNWLSYANDDMASYCLGALRFLNHGYFDSPNLTELLHGKDYSQYLWFTFVPGIIRSGSELLLAWLSGLINQNPAKIFMPLILCFHLVLISSVSAMVLVSKRYKKIALLASVIVACSALTTLGTIYQLIAQVLGLSLFIATGTILQQLFTSTVKYHVLQNSILLCILASTLLISYPEIAPILGLSFIIYLIVALFKGWKPTKPFYSIIILCFIESIILLNTYWVNIITFVYYQIAYGAAAKGSLFPYFLIPSGVATLWGFQPLAVHPSEPWLSISILLGFILSIFTMYLLVKGRKKQYFPATVTLTILFLGIFLCFVQKQYAGFSLFKLAMYIQPFLAAVLAAGIVQQISTKKRKLASLVLVIGFGMGIQFHYVLASYGELGQPYNELPLATKNHLLSQLSNLKKSIPNEATIISDTSSLVSAKFQSLFFSGKQTQFYSKAFFRNSIYAGNELFKKTDPKSYKLALDLGLSLLASEVKLPFLIRDANDKVVSNYFFRSKGKLSDNNIFIMDTGVRSIFNRFPDTSALNANYDVQDMKILSNHIVFVDSSMGQHYYFGEEPHIGMYGLERDYFYPERSMAAIGRYLLFQVINPSQGFRLVFNVTETLRHDGSNQLPSQGKIIGDKEYPLALSGRGSARLFTERLAPRMIDGLPYLMIDLGVDGKAFPRERRGLMRLYGTHISLDRRLLVGFARDVSLISEDEYHQITAPSYLSNFPNDLKNKTLEYSGIYEDGWFSEDVFLVLSQIAQTNFIIQGSMPINGKQNKPLLMTVYVDGEKIFDREINSGPFQFQVKIPTGNLKRNIRLHFSDYSFLPGADKRPVAVKMEVIGFKPKDIGRNYKRPSYIDNFANIFKNNRFEYSGVYQDGWLSKDVYFKLAQQFGQSKLIIDGLLPKKSQDKFMFVDVYVDNFKFSKIPIRPGHFKLAMNIPEGAATRNIQLKFSHDFLISRRDRRSVSIKVNGLGFQ